MKKLPDYQAWAIFAKLAETGSFARTAAELGLSQPTVSKAIRRLEQDQNITLIHRSSRRFALTATGQAALERAGRIVAEAEALEDELHEQTRELQGALRVSAPMSFGLSHLAPLLPEFMQRYPGIVLDVEFSDARTDIVDQGFDLALRISTLEDSSLLALSLCKVQLRLLASPEYVERHGQLTHPRQLAHHHLLRYAYERSPQTWHFKHATAGSFSQQVSAVLRMNNAEGLLPALRGGLGMALLPDFLVWDDLSAGRLLAVLTEWQAPDLVLHVLSPPGRARPARVNVFRDFLVEKLKQEPWAKPY